MRKKLPQPWFRPQRGLWYVTLDGKQHNLGCNEAEAFKRYEQLLRAPKPIAPQVTAASDSVIGLIDKYLEWCQEHRKPETYEWYRWRLQLFVDSIDRRLSVAQLRPYHLDDWLGAHKSKKWSSGTKHNMIRAVQRAMSWAARKGYIDRSPIADYEKPRPGKRNVIISPEEFERILSFVRHATFRDLLIVSWETGCRPQESLHVEARHVDLKHGRWVFPAEESKGEKEPRTVYLTDKALEITQRLVARHHQGPLFRNANGKPWTTDATNCCFTALQHRMGRAVLKQRNLGVPPQEVEAFALTLKPSTIFEGVPRHKSQSELLHEARRKLTHKLAKGHAPRYCLYHLRHSWLDRALKDGVDPLTCALLMGHRDTSMIARVYQHLGQSPEYLRTAALRVSGQRADA